MNPATLKVRLLHDSVVGPADEPRGENHVGRSGEIHELDRWTALHLCHCHPEFPRAELIDKKGK